MLKGIWFRAWGEFTGSQTLSQPRKALAYSALSKTDQGKVLENLGRGSIAGGWDLLV